MVYSYIFPYFLDKHNLASSKCTYKTHKHYLGKDLTPELFSTMNWTSKAKGLIFYAMWLSHFSSTASPLLPFNHYSKTWSSLHHNYYTLTVITAMPPLPKHPRSLLLNFTSPYHPHLFLMQTEQHLPPPPLGAPKG